MRKPLYKTMSETKEQELLPCEQPLPCAHCENDVHILTTERRGIPSGDNGFLTTIVCKNGECGCKIVRWALKKEWSVESAIDAWNRRTAPAEKCPAAEWTTEPKEMGVHVICFENKDFALAFVNEGLEDVDVIKGTMSLWCGTLQAFNNYFGNAHWQKINVPALPGEGGAK